MSYRAPGGLGRLTVRMLYLVTCVTAAAMLARPWLKEGGEGAVVLGLVYAVASVVFALWAHRAASNVVADGGMLEHARWWLLLGWLVPIAGLVRPFQLLRDVYWMSLARIGRIPYGDGPVLAWWGGVLGWVLSTLSGWLAGPNAVIWVRSSLDLVGDAALVIAGMGALIMVQAVNTAQAYRAEARRNPFFVAPR